MIGQSFEERAPRALNVDGMIFYGQKVTGKAPLAGISIPLRLFSGTSTSTSTGRHIYPASKPRLRDFLTSPLCKYRWSDTAWHVMPECGTFVCGTFVGQTKAKYEAFMEANLCSIKIFQGTLVHIMLGVHYRSCYGWLFPARWCTEVL